MTDVAGGFDLATTGHVLTFEGTPYEGLEVTVDEAPLGLLLAIMQDYSKITGEDLDLEGAAGVLTSLMEAFAGVLEGWNLKRKGKPVPPTLDGLRTVGSNFFLAVVGAWLTGNVEADEDLGKGSGSGGTSEEERAAMAALSSALPSSSPQRLLSGCATGGTACRRRCSPSPPGCCGCSTSTGSATATRTRRGVSSHSRQLCIDKHKSD